MCVVCACVHACVLACFSSPCTLMDKVQGSVSPPGQNLNMCWHLGLSPSLSSCQHCLEAGGGAHCSGGGAPPTGGRFAD